MEQDERDFILNSAARLREWENTPRDFDDPYRDMTTEEKSRLLIYQQQMLEEKRRQMGAIESQAARERARADEQTAKLDKIMTQLSALTDMLGGLRDENARLRKALDEANRQLASKDEQLKLGRKKRFGSKSQKGTKSQSPEDRTHEEDKDDFDGTNPILAGCRKELCL